MPEINQANLALRVPATTITGLRRLAFLRTVNRGSNVSLPAVVREILHEAIAAAALSTIEHTPELQA